MTRREGKSFTLKPLYSDVSEQKPDKLKSKFLLSASQELIDAAMMSTSLGGMTGGVGVMAAGSLGGGGASGLGGENGRVMAHDFPKSGAQGLPCIGKAAGLSLSSTGM